MLLWCLLLLTPFAIATSANVVSALLKVPFASKLTSIPVEAKVLESREQNSLDSPIHNTALEVKIAVKCGENQTFQNVLLDTGSSTLWVGGGQQSYKPGSNTQVINATFSQNYASGGASGIAFRDSVVIGDAVARGQIIGAANSTQGFTILGVFDGIRLGPPNTNEGVISGFNNTPTFVQTLAAEKAIDSPMFGLFVNPLGQNGQPEGTGEITFGGFDKSRVKGDVTWVPQNPPFDSIVSHWDFTVSSFSFGDITLNATPARTDSGSYPISLPFDQLFSILQAYNGTFGSESNPFSNGFIAFPRNLTQTLPPLTVTLGNTTISDTPGNGPLTISIPPEGYLIPRELYASFNLTEDSMALSWLTTDGPGMFGLGMRWLEHAYTVYDMENRRIGFAQLA